MILTVRGDRIFVRPASMPTMTANGLLHIVHDRQRATMRGTVVAVGDGPTTRTGVRLPHIVAVGDVVIFSPDAGEELMFEKDLFIAMREHDVLAIVEN